jgi:uncharacterized membrane protein
MRRCFALLGAFFFISGCVEDAPPQVSAPARAVSSTTGNSIASTPGNFGHTGQAASSGEGFRVCNLTGMHVEVAKALNYGTAGKPADIVSEGWYQFAPGDCSTMWSGKLDYRYYLIYAQSKPNNREWAGDIAVCVDSQPFTLRGGTCPAGQYQRNFFQVDTGESLGWTQNLR